MRQTGFRAYFPEWLLNTLFFFILSAVILQLLANTHLLRQDTALLKQAVTACSRAAEFYRNSNGSMEDIAKEYPNGIQVNHRLLVYLNEDFLYCNREAGTYYLLIEENTDDTIAIRFYEMGKDVIYSIEKCSYQASSEEVVAR